MSDPLVLRVNPALKAQDYAESFRRDGIVQIDNIFEPAVADRLAKALKDETYWQLTYADEQEAAIALNKQQLANVDTQALWNEIIQRASKGFSYVYLACHLQGSYGGPEQAEHPMHKLVTFLNSPGFLDFAREVSGHPEAERVDAAATWYRPSDFLTLHTDGVGLRRAAYTLGFTRGWRPDWGGQLLFHDKAGHVERGFMPGFNVLTMFQTPRPHSVAQVAHYATQPRLTISGWLLAGQAQQA